MQSDFRSVVAARERRRQCRDGLQGMVSFASFVREGRHRGLQFPEDIHKVAVARKREMTRPGTGRERGAKRVRLSCIGVRELAEVCVELVNQDSVQAEIGYVGEADLGLDRVLIYKFDAMRVRSVLALLVG